jgi:hypothetical protein
MYPSFDYVYIVRQLKEPVVKIGTSRWWSSRIKALESQKKQVLKPVHLIFTPPGQGRFVEKRLHEHYAECRLSGEWFVLPSEELALLEMYGCGAACGLAFPDGFPTHMYPHFEHFLDRSTLPFPWGRKPMSAIEKLIRRSRQYGFRFETAYRPDGTEVIKLYGSRRFIEYYKGAYKRCEAELHEAQEAVRARLAWEKEAIHVWNIPHCFRCQAIDYGPIDRQGGIPIWGCMACDGPREEGMN